MSDPTPNARDVGAVEIPIGSGFLARVDLADVDSVGRFSWRRHEFQKKDGRVIVYASCAGSRLGFGPRTIYMHRLIAGFPAGQFVDHRDHDTLNNTRDNLRIVTRSQNGANRSVAWSAAGFLGVSLAHGLYQGVVEVDGVRYRTPRYPTPEEAARARDVLALKHFGEFAQLNFSTSEAG